MPLNLSGTKGPKRAKKQTGTSAPMNSGTNLPWQKTGEHFAPQSRDGAQDDDHQTRELLRLRSLGMDFSTLETGRLPPGIDSASTLSGSLELQRHLVKLARKWLWNRGKTLRRASS